MRTIASVGGIGYSPIAPGTLGSAVGAGICWILSASPLQQIVGSLVAIGLGIWSSGPMAQSIGKKDPRPIVIDEVAGAMVALATLPVTLPVYMAGFLLFRFLDIVKPVPVRQLQRLPGSWGIVLDDFVAGLLANLIVRAVLLFLR